MITALLYAGVLLVCGSSVTDAPNETCSSVGEDLIAAEFAHHELAPAAGAVTSSNMTGEGKGLPWTHWDALDFTMNQANIVSSPVRARHRNLAASTR